MADETQRTVIHLVPAMEQGGVETVVCDLNRELVRAGWRSVVMSRGGRLVERIVADGGEHVALDLKSKNPLTFLSRAWRLRKAIEKVARANGGATRPVVCAHSRVPAWLFVGARKLDSILNPRPSVESVAQTPWVTYAHGANSVSWYSAVMTKGDVVVAPSKFLKAFLIENYAGDGSPASKTLRERIRVICPAVNLDRFDPAKVDAAKVAALRQEWGIADGDRVVMAVGRLTPLKGFDHLIRDLAGQLDITPDAAWKDVLRHPRAKLVIVGGADARHRAYEAGLKALAASLGVAERVVFAGQRDCVPECLAAADVVVSGNVTKPESFGLSVAEALAMNKPVRLLRRFGGAAEILDEVGRLCDAATDERGASSPREAIRTLCSPQTMAEATLAAYAAARSRAV